MPLSSSSTTSRQNKPSYKSAPVRDNATLAHVLGLAERQLSSLAAAASRMYRRKAVPKKDGTERITWDPYPQLKDVQGIINAQFFRKTKFPLYLHGGIRDVEYPRDYVRNAKIHAGAYLAVTVDIENFFPSVRAEQVFDIWFRFFRFDRVVAETLTLLTTRDGFLPQGARTSNYLANLIFWEHEHSLVDELAKHNWRYSRLTDDITVSTTNRSAEDLTSVNRLVIGILHRYGFRMKRSKHKILRRNKQMTVNNLVINEKAALPKAERKRIRAQVHQTKSADVGIEGPSVASTRGKIGKVARMHPGLAEKLLDDLNTNVING
jgi:hypothetical protein